MARRGLRGGPGPWDAERGGGSGAERERCVRERSPSAAADPARRGGAVCAACSAERQREGGSGGRSRSGTQRAPLSPARCKPLGRAKPRCRREGERLTIRSRLESKRKAGQKIYLGHRAQPQVTSGTRRTHEVGAAIKIHSSGKGERRGVWFLDQLKSKLLTPSAALQLQAHCPPGVRRQSRPFVTQQDQGTRIPQGQGDWKSVRVDRWNGKQVALLPELLTPELPLAHVCKLNKSQISVVF
ncbi:uncharacterized protein LOC125701343 [Lagopus muta]|uniref:uncharacterized protein LOC125701343 n=1 Tax=Lagopus muta TaxID=64668 RepID=UPI0020A0BBA1|nr:uncharacterized protein LOC125701343 [Lagopus muta]